MNVSMVVIKGTSFIKGETLGERRKKKDVRHKAFNLSPLSGFILVTALKYQIWGVLTTVRILERVFGHVFVPSGRHRRGFLFLLLV